MRVLTSGREWCQVGKVDPRERWVRSPGETVEGRTVALAPGGDTRGGLMRLFRSLIFTDDRGLDGAQHILLDINYLNDDPGHDDTTDNGTTDHRGDHPSDPASGHGAAQG